MFRRMLGTAAFVAVSTIANAQPIRLVVPYLPGGATDLVGRALAVRMASETGRPLVVENRAGAGGMSAAENVARSPADGANLLLATSVQMALMPNLRNHLVVNPARDLAPITMVAAMPYVLLVRSGHNADSFPVLMAGSKSSPVKMASSGMESESYAAQQLLGKVTGIQLVHVPYQGLAPAMQDLLAGHVDATILPISFALTYVSQGKVRPIAVAAPSRSPVMPSVPTFHELGYPQLEMSNWMAVFAPAALAKERVEALNVEFRRAIPAVGDITNMPGLLPIHSTPEELRSYVDAETRKWAFALGKAPDIGVPGVASCPRYVEVKNARGETKDFDVPAYIQEKGSAGAAKEELTSRLNAGSASPMAQTYRQILAGVECFSR